MHENLVESPPARTSRALFRFAEDAGLLHSRVRVPVLVCAAFVLLCGLERLAMVTLLSDRFAGIPASDVLWAFIVGLRFDLVVACMALLLIVPLVSLLSPSALRSRKCKWLVGVCCGLAVSACGFISIVDFFFFRQFTERLDARAISYIGEEGNEYLLHLLLTRYPLIPALLVFVVGVIVVARLVVRWGFNDERTEFKLWQAAGWPALAMPLLILGVRGTVSSHAINSSVAYYSSSPAVSQLALNGAFTLRQAIISSTVKSVDLARMYPLLPHEEAVQRTLALAVSPQDEVLGDKNNPLRRITRTGRDQKDYNVVLVVLESLSWHYIGELGGDTRLTPNLNQLAREGLLFEKCFAVGERTQRGFAGIVSGYPDLPEYSVTTRDEITGNFITLGSVLAKRGYETSFIYAGPGHRDHRQAYMGSNGYSRFVTMEDMVTKTFQTKLGYCDEDLFNTADAEFRKSRRPFFATLLTLSFHAPFDIPADTIEPVEPAHPHAAQLNCIRYTDWAIGRFMEKARESEYFRDTIFVFAADHMGGYREDPTTPASYRVPFLIYAPGIVKAERLSGVCSQMDIAPTIMWLLGGEYEHSFFGSSVLGAGPRYAITLGGDGELIYHDADDRVMTVPPYGGAGKLLQYQIPETLVVLDAPDALAEGRRNAIAVLQVAQWVFDHLGEPSER